MKLRRGDLVQYRGRRNNNDHPSGWGVVLHVSRVGVQVRWRGEDHSAGEYRYDPAELLRQEERGWPSRAEFNQMTPHEVNRFFASRGVETRVVE